MSDFTASNGIKVENHGGNWDRTTIHFSGEVLGLTEERKNARDMVFEDEDYVALREFFQAEADVRLGRWRWPENPEYVVYPHRRVLHEATGGSWDVDALSGTRAPRIALAAYEAWQDVRFPKPWREAKTGEVWAVTRCGGAEHPMVVEGDAFVDLKPGEGDRRLAFQRDDKLIQRAHRIWPEESK